MNHVQKRNGRGSVGANTSTTMHCSYEPEPGAADSADLTDVAQAIMLREQHSAAKCCPKNSTCIWVNS